MSLSITKCYVRYFWFVCSRIPGPWIISLLALFDKVVLLMYPDTTFSWRKSKVIWSCRASISSSTLSQPISFSLALIIGFITFHSSKIAHTPALQSLRPTFDKLNRLRPDRFVWIHGWFCLKLNKNGQNLQVITSPSSPINGTKLDGQRVATNNWRRKRL